MITTWARLIPDDVIRGVDGGDWLILATSVTPLTCRIEMRNPASGRTVTGTPRPDSVVTVLTESPIREILAVFGAAGLPAEYLETINA